MEGGVIVWFLGALSWKFRGKDFDSDYEWGLGGVMIVKEVIGLSRIDSGKLLGEGLVLGLEMFD